MALFHVFSASNDSLEIVFLPLYFCLQNKQINSVNHAIKHYIGKCILNVREFGHVRIVVRRGRLFAIGEASDLQGRILVGTKK